MGFTLLELLLVLSLTAIVLGIAGNVGLRLERQLAAESRSFAAGAQLAAAAEVLPIDLRALSAAAGDVVAGAARDTSLEIRAVAMSGVLCAAAAPMTLTIAVHRGPLGRALSPHADPGDTLWVLVHSDSTELWRPLRIATLKRTTASCPYLTASADQVFDIGHLWAVEVRDSIELRPGAVVRLTKRERFSFYRAGDSQWYLGLRMWNGSASAFNGVQPISGPYVAPTSAGGARFRYYDDAGVQIPSGALTTTTIARIETRLAVEGAAAASSPDSLILVVALRNRDE